MIDFDFVSPTKIFFGLDKEKQVGKILSDYGFKKILLVYGGDSIKKSGLYNVIINSLENASVSYFELSGVRPNPTRELVSKGLDLAKQNKVEAILAVGGGSVIDTAKSISVGFYYDGDSFDFNIYKSIPQNHLPVGVVLTISAAGSEASNSCVISDDKNMVKSGFNNEHNRPLFVIENPKLTFSVNSYQTASGITDIMMHTLERFFSTSGKFELADNLALGLLKTVKEAGAKVMTDPNDYDSRASIMLCSTISHNGLTSIGKNYEMPCHQLEHALSAYDPKITHGAGLAVVFIAWANYVYTKNIAKFSLFAKEVFNVNCENDLQCAKIGINLLQEYFKSLGMPTSIREFGLTKADIPQIVNIATRNDTRVIGRLVPLTAKDVEAIYASCL